MEGEGRRRGPSLCEKRPGWTLSVSSGKSPSLPGPQSHLLGTPGESLTLEDATHGPAASKAGEGTKPTEPLPWASPSILWGTALFLLPRASQFAGNISPRVPPSESPNYDPNPLMGTVIRNSTKHFICRL